MSEPEDGVHAVCNRPSDRSVNKDDFALAAFNVDRVGVVELGGCHPGSDEVVLQPTFEERILSAIRRNLTRGHLGKLQGHVSIVGDRVGVQSNLDGFNPRC